MKDKKKWKEIIKYILIVLAVIALLILIEFMRWNKDMKEHPAQKLEAYLEECFDQDVSVYVDEESYFTTHISSEQIPYQAQVILADGNMLKFSVNWERGVTLDYGVYTDYGDELAKYYANKYGMSSQITPNWVEVTMTRDDFLGDTPKAKQFFMELWESSYIQSGQTLKLYLASEIGISSYLAMCLEEPSSCEEVYKNLTTFEMN